MKHIAVVEDNVDNRLLVGAILQDHYQVTEHASGPEALAGMAGPVPGLVLLDISLPLPEMDGSEVLRRMRADARLRGLDEVDGETFHEIVRTDPRYAHLPIVVVTAGELVPGSAG